MFFKLKIHSMVDVITNSSSELFVGKSKSREALEALIAEIYPDYRREYYAIRSSRDLSNDDLFQYLDYEFNSWSNENQCTEYRVVPGFAFKEMYDADTYGGRTSFFIKESFVPDNRREIIKAIDPEREMFFMFSIDENPDWDYQEKLMKIMERYHLG